MKKRTIGIVGIVLFTMAIASIVLKHIVEMDFLKRFSEYGIYVAGLGGGLIGLGFFGKKKKVE